MWERAASGCVFGGEPAAAAGPRHGPPARVLSQASGCPPLPHRARETASRQRTRRLAASSGVAEVQLECVPLRPGLRASRPAGRPACSRVQQLAAPCLFLKDVDHVAVLQAERFCSYVPLHARAVEHKPDAAWGD